MKKSLISFSTLALFAGAAMAADPEFIGGGRTTDDVSSIENTLSSGVYGNVAGGTGGVQNGNINSNGAVDGDVLLNLSGATIKGWIIGGNTANSSFDADGNDYLKGVSGKITVNFNDGTLLDNTEKSANVAGLRGGLSGAYTHATVGSIELNLNGGEMRNSFVMAAGGNGSANILGDVVVNASGTNIFGRSYTSRTGNIAIVGVQGSPDPTQAAYGYGAEDSGNSMGSYLGGRIKGALRINISAGEINGNIWGAYADSRIDGGTHILLSGGVVNGDVNLGVAEYNAYVGASDVTFVGDAVVNGTVYGKMKADSRAKERYMESASMYIGTADKAYTGSSVGAIADFDKIVVAKGSSASAKSISHDFVGNIPGQGSHNFVSEGADFVVEGDIVNTLTNATNSGSFVAGLTSSRVDQKSGGSAIVKGTVKTVIDGADTKLNLVYGGNGGNQKGTMPHLRGMMESSVGAVDLTVNDGYMAMILASGAMFSDVAGNVDVKINGGKIDGVYGVASNGNVGGDVNITMTGGTITGDKAGDYVIGIAAGGANNADADVSASTISGSTNIVLGGTANVQGDVFGGGWGGFTNAKQGGLIKGDTNITIKGDAVVAGTIYGGGVAGMTDILGSKNLNIGTADEAYNGTTALKVADFDTVTVNKGTNAKIESLEFNQTGAVVSGVSVNDGASLVVEGDVVRNYNNITNSGSLVSGINGGDAVVKGTVKTVIDGADTKLAKFYGGNGGNQKQGEYTYNGEIKSGPIPKGTSTVGAVDITINNGTISDFMIASGAMHSDVLGNVDLKINGGYVDSIFGGACGANVGGDVNITVNGGKIGNIAAGSCGSGENIREDGIVGGSTNVVLGGDAVVSGDVYGGGWSGGEKWRDTVKGGTNITLKDSAAVSGTIYGGSWSGTGTIGGDKSLNIGTADSAYNGQYSLKIADFQKISVVNGSADISSFTQAAEGTLITVASGAKLAMTANAAGQFSNTELSNNGSFALRRGGLADSAQTVFKGYSGNGEVSAYGGVFDASTGTFTAGKSAEVGAAAKVGSDLVNDIQSVSYKQDGKELLSLDFDVSKMGDKKLSVVSVDAVDASQKGNIEGDFLGGYAVSVDNADGAEFGVVFSAYIGEVEEPSNIMAWHKANGSDIWEKLETTVEYKDGVASIIVNGFSAYAFSIPEPSTYAIILGVFAMALAAYRRSKK